MILEEHMVDHFPVMFFRATWMWNSQTKREVSRLSEPQDGPFSVWEWTRLATAELLRGG